MDETLGRKGYLLKVSQMSRYSAFVGKVIGCNLPPWGAEDVPGEHHLSRGRGFVLGADGELTDVICNVCIDAGPINCLSCMCLHLLHPLMGSLQIGEGTVEEFWGNTDLASLEEEAGLYGQFLPGTPEVSDNPWDLLPAIQPSP